MKFVALTAEHWPWVKETINALWVEDTKGIVAIDANDKVVGALVLDSWTDTACMTHIAVTNPMAIRRGLFEETYRYVFETCGRQMMLGATPSSRTKALELVARLGWEQLYRLKDGFSIGEDIVYSRYTKNQWLMRRAA